MKLPRIDRTAFFIWLALCLVGGGLLSWFTVVPFWGGSLIVTAALIINGVIAEVEDNSPDGFNNPNNNQNVFSTIFSNHPIQRAFNGAADRQH